MCLGPCWAAWGLSSPQPAAALSLLPCHGCQAAEGRQASLHDRLRRPRIRSHSFSVQRTVTNWCGSAGLPRAELSAPSTTGALQSLHLPSRAAAAHLRTPHSWSAKHLREIPSPFTHLPINAAKTRNQPRKAKMSSALRGVLVLLLMYGELRMTAGQRDVRPKRNGGERISRWARVRVVRLLFASSRAAIVAAPQGSIARCHAHPRRGAGGAWIWRRCDPCIYTLCCC